MSWAFSKTEVMAPMRHLLSPKTEFLWTQELQKSFEESKAKIVEASRQGIKTFEIGKPTVLSTDWSKVGIGFCLLQKKGSCEEVTPVCCPDG